jgi:type IX secretion system PorP/SprF family membrane protein
VIPLKRCLKKKQIITLVAFLICAAGLKSQQLPVFSQHMMNNYLINPAIAGHDGLTTFTLTGREQWIGIKDAPASYAFNIHGRMTKSSFISRSPHVRRGWKSASRPKKVGLGANIFTDFNGAFNRTGFQLTYAYHIPLYNSQLSLGFSLTGFQFSLNESKIVLHDEDDEQLLNLRKSTLIPDANAGIYYTNPDFYIGISAMQLFESMLKIPAKEKSLGFKMVRHYFLTTGYRYKIDRNVFIEPSVLLKTTEKFFSQLDINATIYINKQYWGGLSYRTGGNYSLAEESIGGTGSSIIIMGGVKYEKYYLGYSFDYTLSAIGKRSWGSHEIFISAKIGETSRKYRWLNRY